MELLRFLEERIAEDLTAAQAVTDPDIVGTIWCAENDGALTTDEAREQANYVDRYSVNRALDEYAVKRAIVTSYESCRAAEAGAKELSVKLTISGMVKGLEMAVKSLAYVYSDHPDYDETWEQ